jgi:DNA-binding IclR family transcriptional regulator
MRVIDLLERLATAPDGLGLKELSATLGVPKSSLLPLLRTLVARGYLEQRGGAYRLGARAAALGSGWPAGRVLAEVARPELVALMRRTGETVLLAALAPDASSVVYLDRVESEQLIRYSSGVGDRRDLHATSSGKVLLAFLPAERRERILRSLRLTRYTERTLTSLPALRAALDEIRRRGTCVNVDEIVAGATGVAAPVFDRWGAVVAACVVAGPTERIRFRTRQLDAAARATARAVSRLLGAALPTGASGGGQA